MRLVVLLTSLSLCFAASSRATDTRTRFEEALQTFRTDGPRGWSFTQTSESGSERRVERFDAAKPDFTRWTLLELNGRPPTETEARDYREKLTRRSLTGNAPHLSQQFDLSTLKIVSESDERAVLQCRLKPGEDGDDTAQYLAATLTFHKPTATIQQLEIASTQPFSPTFGVKIEEMRTLLTYSLPTETHPPLLQKSSTRLRGRAFYFKSLDADLTVTFTDYEKARLK